MKVKINKNKIIAIICAVCAAIFIFVAGFLTATLIKNKTTRSFEWIVKTINKNYYQTVDQNALVSYAMNGGVEKLLDQYSEYYTKEEYQSVVLSNSGSKSGIGISFTFIQDKGVLLNSVVGNSPAYISGLRRGMVVTSGIDATGDLIKFSSSNDFSAFISGFNTGEPFSLFDENNKSYSLSKNQYTASYTMLCTNQTAWGFTSSTNGTLALKEYRDEKMEFLPEGAAYLSLSQFYGTASWEVSELIEKYNAQNCSSLILDLRENGGGYLNVMQELTYIFTADRDINGNIAAYAEYKNGSRENFKIIKNKNYNVLPSNSNVYVLANENSASASEALIGALISYDVIDYSNIYLSEYSQDYIKWMSSQGYGVKNGSTYGKGIMQSTFTNMWTGEALKLTTAKIYWPNGKSIHGVGITAADGCKTVPAEWSVTLNDEELQNAVRMIY